MADLPFELAAPLAQRLRTFADIEGKIPRALQALGPLTNRRVGLIDVPAGALRDALAADADVRDLPRGAELAIELPDESLDTVVSLWSGFHGVDPRAIAEVDRVLAPFGRLLVVHDYGRDDASALADPDAPQYGRWSRRDGPFLRDAGFKIRVLHCFWTFPSIDAAREFLAEAFGERGVEVGDGLKRPRISWNVAVYHRWRHGVAPPDAPEDDAAEPHDADHDAAGHHRSSTAATADDPANA